MRRMSLQVGAAAILVLVALALLLQARRGIASGDSGLPAVVRGISIHNGPDGAAIIEVTVSRPVTYRTLRLSNPSRFVVDLQDARKADVKPVYPADSRILARVRVGQFQSNPAIVRVVADLKAIPSFSVKTLPSGIRIQLNPRAGSSVNDPPPRVVEAQRTNRSPAHPVQAAQAGTAPRVALPVHQFKELSASLTAPTLPRRDKLVPVTSPAPTSSGTGESDALALVSGVSIRPSFYGDTTIDIASSRSVPYRVFQLTDPFRLVIDLKDARQATPKNVYETESPVLKRVRIGQWRPESPSVVRVVADLAGYPIFDVHAQQPGIRVELRPREGLGPLFRNPFEYAKPPARISAARSSRPATATPDLPTALHRASFANLKVLGFVDKPDTGLQAVIFDHGNIYFVPKGGTFENTYSVLAISPSAVQVQNLQTLETGWLPYNSQ
jgi:hypothetical protein